MLNARRVAAAFLVASVLIALQPAAAFADGGTGGAVCTDPNDPVCDVFARTPGSPGGGSAGNQNPGGRSGGGDDGTGAQCTYTPAYPSAATIAALGGQPTGEGGWYFKTCVYPNGLVVAFPGVVWVPGPPPVVSPEVLARQARSRLRLPVVVVRLNPAGDQLVNLPTWLAVDSGSWQSQSATASVPGISVTATARPVRATWSTGDGGLVTCSGPGTAWQPGTDPMQASPDCGYTYRRSSAGAAGAVFTVTVTITWDVTWAGGGQAGTVPGLTTTGSVGVRVQESQALITN